MTDERPIGLLDSGVGGLTVVRELTKTLPDENIVYYGDTLHLPYGPRLLDEVKEFVFQIIDFLIYEKQAKAIILACNTATSAALEAVQEKYPIPIFGTIDGATSRSLKISRTNKVGVIGTEGTVNSQAYQRSLMELDHQLEVFSAACPRFVELVEEGKFSGPEVQLIAHKYLDGLRKSGIDALILGCTHFPYLIPEIQEVMGEEVTLVNPAVEMALEVKQVLTEKKLLKGGGSQANILTRQEFLVSDKKRVSELFLAEGNKFLGLPSLDFKEVNIFDKGEENV